MPSTSTLPRTAVRSAPPVRVPSWPVLAASTATALAGVLVLPAVARAEGLVTVGLVGYLLGALVTPVLAVVARWQHQRASSSRRFVVVRWHARVLHAALGIGLAAGLVHAWLVATELARA